MSGPEPTSYRPSDRELTFRISSFRSPISFDRERERQRANEKTKLEKSDFGTLRSCQESFVDTKQLFFKNIIYQCSLSLRGESDDR